MDSGARAFGETNGGPAADSRASSARPWVSGGMIPSVVMRLLKGVLLPVAEGLLLGWHGTQ